MLRHICLLGVILIGLATAAHAQQYVGKASYYSDELEGHRMSNGERYHRDSFTCAHRKFPMGTMLRVRNPLNGHTVTVEVTDRGPFSAHRIIDLSRAAAQELGFLRAGLCQVEITPLHTIHVPLRVLEDDLPEIPELDLHYVVAAVWPEPLWKQKPAPEGKQKATPKGKQKAAQEGEQKKMRSGK